MKYLLIGLLKLYRAVVSPLYGNVCRYYPSCSAYALQAVQVHGAVRGAAYAIRRLLRCHPWAPGGYDPVPGTPEFATEMRDRAQSAATMAAGQTVAGEAAERSGRRPDDGAATVHADEPAATAPISTRLVRGVN